MPDDTGDHDTPRRSSVPDADPAAGLRRLRRDRVGDLVADEVPTPVKFIIDGRDGRLVMPVSREQMEASELVLWVPAERFESLQLLLSAEPHTDDLDEARDRYLAYHGTTELPCWIACRVQSGRCNDEVYDGAELTVPNAARDREFAVCRLLNADKPRLAELSELMAGVKPESPTAVGVDDGGIDVRASLGVFRIEFPSRAADGDEAERIVRALLDGAA